MSIKKNKEIKLDLGCWDYKKSGFIGVDIIKGKHVDIVHDLDKGIPFKDGEVDEIYASHFLEHVNDPSLLFQEMYRVLKKKGVANIIVPHYSNPGAYTFLHKSYWSYVAVNKKVLTYYLNCPFREVNVKIHTKLFASIPIINKFFNWFININAFYFERFFNIFFIDEVRIHLKK